MNRREFLKLSLALTLGGLTMTAEAAEKFSARRIDFHAHAILPSYVDALKKLKIDAVAEEGFPLPKWSAESHLQFMAAAGIDFTVLSMATPHISDKFAARAINEEFAELCRRFPKKFGFVATLPLPDIDRLNRRIFLRDGKTWSTRREPARTLPRSGVVTGKVMALFEYPADTTRAVLNMPANGTLEKFPRLKVVVPHCGSFLPYMKQRAGSMFQMLASMNLMPPTNFSASFDRLFFDTAGDPMPEQFDILLKVTSLDKIIFGTDYPYIPAQVVLGRKKLFDTELSRRGLTEKIYVDNAKNLLGG